MSLSTNIYNQHSNKNELNSFRKAVASNNKQSIQKHLSHMKNLSEMQLTTALFICIENFRLEDQSDECLYLLLRNKANPNCEINGQTPLIAACKIGQLTMVKNLVENGAKPDLCNSQGKHPLEFILCARKQNYDVADYLISVISTVNMEIGKTHAIIVTVEKEFARIFKMLVDKGATLIFNNQETILHIIMKKKFSDPKKKKRFIKQLANRPQLSQSRDKFGKLPIDYQTQDEIKGYYSELFKPKLKNLIEKQLHHSKIKQKQSRQKDFSKQKQHKKKLKQEEQSSAVEEEGVDEEQNDQEGYNALNHEEDKQKIVEVVEQQEQQKKIEEQKEKIKKNIAKVLTPTAVINNKKSYKPNVKSSFGQKSSIIDRSIVVQKIIQKQKTKKINNDKKVKTQIYSKKNKSFTGSKKNQIDQEKKQEEPKKKLSVRGVNKEDQSKKVMKKQSSQIKLEQVKVQKKNQQEIEHLQPEKNKFSLSIVDQATIKNIMQQFLRKCQQTYEQNIQQQRQKCINEQQQNLQRQQKYSQSQISSQKQPESINFQLNLAMQIMQFYTNQQQKIAETRLLVENIIIYLQNKMKLCIQSHINQPFTFRLVVYGSQATGMAINESDVDLMIISNLSTQQLMNIFEFYRIFEEEQIKDFKFLKNATIPVTKLNFGETFNNIKCDITVLFGNHQGLRCAELMQEFKMAEPLLLPLVIALKRLIYCYNIADPYTGGLSSYSLTLMTIALLQMTQTQKTKQNIGKILLQFLSFYGIQLEYICQAIIIQPPYHQRKNLYGYQQFYNIYELPSTWDLSSKLVIYDPLDPTNNVGRCTYRILCLKTLFKVSYMRLKLDNLSFEALMKPEFTQLIEDY